MINLVAKKVYCPKCQKLRGIKVTKSGDKTQYNCVVCNHMMWQKEGLKWKYLKVR